MTSVFLNKFSLVSIFTADLVMLSNMYVLLIISTLGILGKFIKIFQMINSLPNTKFLDLSKLKVSADDKTNVTENLNFVLGRVDNIAGKRENAFLLFPQCFHKAPYTWSGVR